MGFGKQVNTIRKQNNMTLQELSTLSKVSASMLSQIERDEKNPTIQVACQIAEALNTTLSALLDQQEKRDIIIMRADERPTYFDEKFGFQRHLLSPAFPSRGIEFVKNIIPPHSESGIFPAHKPGVKEYIYVEKGQLVVELGIDDFHGELLEGDSLFFEADTEHRFINNSISECHYFLVIDSTQSKI
ncbi:XRE family transcriptional regulator [Lysinibacillus sp. FSL H8-0500]|uniref:XRE family transcriptional regulator n=1 Tax=Lysinibacillus macroides TaxID=33935 RepID=A0A0N0UWK8_9BACI|nr:XRE family transcriptional regulator [Lysinibacillus macroides]KOY81615.1 XRE family transcriptional regulator [Lysinibacillus macroides]QPR69538.1 helix-turn-helix transcriptional regulator [Lysinibacillus macroides]